MTDGAARTRSSARRSSAGTANGPAKPPKSPAPRKSAVPPESLGLPEFALAEFAARRDALQQAAGLPGAQLKPLLDAAFAELDGAIDALTQRQASAAARRAGAPAEPVRAERRLLRAVFQEAPVPLFLLERDGTVRRVNNRASDIIGSRPAYAAGKPFTLFVDLPSRAAVQTYLAAAARTGPARQTRLSSSTWRKLGCRTRRPAAKAAATSWPALFTGGCDFSVRSHGAPNVESLHWNASRTETIRV